MEDGVVEDGCACVLVDALDVLGGGEAEAFIGLSHQVADEDAGAAGAGEGFGDSFDEQIGDERGVKRAGADGDEVSGFDGAEGFGHCGGVGRVEPELGDALMTGGDIGFTTDERAVGHVRDECGVGSGDGKDAAARGEDLRGELDGVCEVAGDLSERGDEEIAEAVAFKSVAGAEAVGKKFDEEIFFFAEGDHAVAEVAGGQHVEVLAEAAG